MAKPAAARSTLGNDKNMKLWLSLLLVVLLTACGGGDDSVTPETQDSGTAQTGTRSSASRAEDQGGVDKIDTAPPIRAKSQSRPDGGPASGGSGGERSAGSPARAGAGAGGSGAAERVSAGSGEGSPAQRDADSEEASPKQRDADMTSAMMPEVGGDDEEDAGQVGPNDASTSVGDAEPGMDLDTDMGMGMDAGIEQPMSASNTGSCCIASTEPGCADADIQACVCELLPACCTDAWDESCTFVVQQKYCQPGVRACVCGSAEGQWQQAYCCEQGWTDTCESVAINKCGATGDCRQLPAP